MTWMYLERTAELRRIHKIKVKCENCMNLKDTGRCEVRDRYMTQNLPRRCRNFLPKHLNQKLLEDVIHGP